MSPTPKPTAPPSLAWVILCPIPGALTGFLLTGIVFAILGWLFSFEVPAVIPIAGAVAGAISFFLVNLKWYRQGYTPPGIAIS